MSFLIGLAGRARSGKDTVGTHLAVQYDYVTMALAEPLRQAVLTMFCLAEADLKDEKKEQPLPGFGKSPRQLMQLLGTEFGRQMVCEDVWLRVMARRIEMMITMMRTEGWQCPGVVITDVRFENEADWIRRHGGRIFHIEREAAQAVNPHASEAGVTRQDGDYTIQNNGTYDELYARVDGIMSMLRQAGQGNPPPFGRLH